MTFISLKRVPSNSCLLPTHNKLSNWLSLFFLNRIGSPLYVQIFKFHNKCMSQRLSFLLIQISFLPKDWVSCLTNLVSYSNKYRVISCCNGNPVIILNRGVTQLGVTLLGGSTWTKPMVTSFLIPPRLFSSKGPPSLKSEFAVHLGFPPWGIIDDQFFLDASSTIVASFVKINQPKPKLENCNSGDHCLKMIPFGTPPYGNFSFDTPLTIEQSLMKI